jgi:23S rRNA (guanosine2251-2'-O)-methyltransferase
MRQRHILVARTAIPGKTSQEQWVGGTLCGINTIREALEAGERTLEAIWVAEGKGGKRIREVLAMAAQRGTSIAVVPEPRLTEAAGTSTHQGLVAFLVPMPLLTLEEVMTRLTAQDPVPPIVILDGIKDPRNLGAIIRSAAAFGAGGMVLPIRRAAGITATVAKAAAGGLEHVALVQVTNLSQSVERLKQAGFWIVGADEQGDTPCTSFLFPAPLGLVFGEEGKGISPLVKRHCDVLVRIPLPGRLHSLNVSVAAAVLFYEVMRQRR